MDDQAAAMRALVAMALRPWELRQQINAIETGAVTITDSQLAPEWNEFAEIPPYNGVVEYRCSNGWRLAVFWDCGEWDYFEWIEAPDGRRATIEELHASGSPLADYRPTCLAPYGGPYQWLGD